MRSAALLLGAVQGLTEFLPVSSSGHLVLIQTVLPGSALASPGVLFEAVVHLGTLAAALIFLRSDVFWLVGSLFSSGVANRESVRAGRRMATFLLVATAPAVVIGLAFQETIRAAFDGPASASGGLVLTGATLLGFRRLGNAAASAGAGGAAPSHPAPPRRVSDALLIGLAQAAALLPGVSRSGATILAGASRGLPPGDAARFSFLLAAPAIAGAALLEGGAVLSDGALRTAGAGLVALELTLGFLAAFAAGTLALRWVFDWLGRQRFHQFGWYCLFAGGIGIGLSSA